MPRISKHKLALAFAISVAPIAVVTSPASAALPVVDISAILRLGQQLQQQALQLAQQVQQTQMMLKNMTSLPSQEWGQTMQAIRSVNQVMQQAQQLSYQSGNIEQQIRAKFQGYSQYAGTGVTSAGMQQKYKQWSTDTNSSLESVMKGLGLQNSQFDDEEAIMQKLEAMGNSAQGRMQAAEVGNQLAAQAVRQTQKLRQLQMMQLQMQASYMAQQADREAALQAAGSRAYTKSNFPVTGGKAY